VATFDWDELVRRCRQGELAAFTKLFHGYEGLVYRLAVTILRHEQDAEAVVQDAFLRVFERIKAFRGESSFRAWLTVIVVNLCRDKLRRRKVRRALSLERLRGQVGHSAAEVIEVVGATMMSCRVYSMRARSL
jgi:RNA polymerase sigma factor (sigma-70 family)